MNVQTELHYWKIFYWKLNPSNAGYCCSYVPISWGKRHRSDADGWKECARQSGGNLWHSFNAIEISPPGVVALWPGEFGAGCGSFLVKIERDQQCLNPVLAAASSIVSLQQIVSREVDPLDSQVVMVAMVHSETDDSVAFGGTFRAFGRQSFNNLRTRIKEIIQGQASVYMCSAEVDFESKDHATCNTSFPKTT